MTAKIKMLDAKGKFGFVGQPGRDRHDDYFFHQSALANCGFADLAVGQEVDFEVGTDRQGRPCAECVNVL